jgi:UPF0755 protein
VDGFKRPRNQVQHSSRAQLLPPVVEPPPLDDIPPLAVGPPLELTKSSTLTRRTSPTGLSKRTSRLKKWWVITGVIVILGALLAAAISWYFLQLTPVSREAGTSQKIVIERETSFSYVVDRLKARGLIRSTLATSVYGILSGTRGQLKEGSCEVSPSQSTQQILEKLTTGCHDFKSITFFPGATIEQPLYKPVHAELDATMYIKYRLRAFGFTDEQVKAALAKQYTGPLFADKPADSSLEGYIYGETYYVDIGATPEDVLQTAFDEMYAQLSRNELLPKFRTQGLSLYQAITLSSIVQRELNCEGKPTEARKETCFQYQRIIAQVFLKRLREGISLGSDVTFIYAADMRGVAPTVDIDSPYNTRVHTGLPPGPIASPGIHALRAVADPSATDYLFFIAGDDGLIYFAKDQAGHEANIRDHCQKLCNEL